MRSRKTLHSEPADLSCREWSSGRGYLGRMNPPACYLLLTFAFLGSTAFAQEAPLVGRPIDYSGIAGRFRVEASIEPAAVAVEEPVLLRVTIRGEPAGRGPDRKNLRIFPGDLDAQFYREDLPDLDRVDKVAKSWTFAWRLRSAAVTSRLLCSARASLSDGNHGAFGNLRSTRSHRPGRWELFRAARRVVLSR